jgi:hypothetical protein
LTRIHVAFPQESSASSIRVLQAHVSILRLLLKDRRASPKSSQRKHNKKRKKTKGFLEFQPKNITKPKKKKKVYLQKIHRLK